MYNLKKKRIYNVLYTCILLDHGQPLCEFQCIFKVQSFTMDSSSINTVIICT